MVPQNLTLIINIVWIYFGLSGLRIPGVYLSSVDSWKQYIIYSI